MKTNLEILDSVINQCTFHSLNLKVVILTMQTMILQN